MINFLPLMLASLVVSTPLVVESNNNIISYSQQDYNQGYNDGYNAAINSSIFSPDNINIVLTLPYDNSGSIDTAMYPVQRSTFNNWFSAGTYDFRTQTFNNEWLDFYNDVQDVLIDIGNEATLTMFIDFRVPVSFLDFSFNGQGFTAYAFKYYNNNSALVWNYAQTERENSYFNWTTPTSTADASSILIKSLYLQFNAKFTSSTRFEILSNTLTFTDTSLSDYNKGFENGKVQGYENGLQAGQELGFNDGYDQAREYYEDRYDILKNDYDTLLERYNSLSADQWNLRHLFWSIGSVPFETFKQIWNFEFLGFNITSFITRISY